MIDAVANIGFNITCHFVGKVYIPYLPTSVTERESEKPIRFIRRQIPTSATPENPSKMMHSQIAELESIESSYLFKVETL